MSGTVASSAATPTGNNINNFSLEGLSSKVLTNKQVKIKRFMDDIMLFIIPDSRTAVERSGGEGNKARVLYSGQE